MAPYYQRIEVLLNRRAGKQDATAAQIAEAFRACGCDAEVRVLDGPSIGEAARDAATRGSGVVVAAGGDGTISAAAAALAGSETPLGVLPVGTLNHFSKDLGVPQDIRQAAEVIAAGRTARVDVGELNGRPFVNNASIGMYAQLVSERSAMQRLGREKWIAHGLAALRVWRQYRRLHVTLRVEGASTTVQTPFVFVGNNVYQLSGLELGGRRTLSESRLQVCMAPGMSRRNVARLIASAIFSDLTSVDVFATFTAPSVTLDAGAPRIHASMDGEVVLMDNPLTFRTRPGALRVVVP